MASASSGVLIWKVTNPKDKSRDDIAMYDGRTVQYNDDKLAPGDYTLECYQDGKGFTGAFRCIEIDMIVKSAKGDQICKISAEVNPKQHKYVTNFTVGLNDAPATINLNCVGHAKVRSLHFRSYLTLVPFSENLKASLAASEDGSIPDCDRVSLPHVCWSRSLGDSFSGHKEFGVSALDAVRLASLGLRMKQYIDSETEQGRLPIMNPFYKSPAGPRMGVPLGGIGGGNIGRGWRGEFGRWSIIPGFPNYSIIDADQFSAYISQPDGTGLATVLNPTKPPKSSKVGKAWNFGMSGKRCKNYSLYPQSFTTYSEPDPKVILTCRQISPVIPHNYKESSYPVGVFEWTIENNSNLERTVSLMFTFQNGLGEKFDSQGGHENKWFVDKTAEGKHVEGINFKYNVPAHSKILEGVKEKKQSNEAELKDMYSELDKERVEARAGLGASGIFTEVVQNVAFNKGKEVYDPLSFSIAATSDDPTAGFFHMSKFVTEGRAGDKTIHPSALWKDFALNGTLSNKDGMTPSKAGQSVGGAICVRVKVPAGGVRNIIFSLAWDNPICRFNSGSGYFRRYTKFFGKSGNNANHIAIEGLSRYKSWVASIEKWQRPILEDNNLPDWYKQALFNELYYLVEGGSIWTAGKVSDDHKVREEQMKEKGSMEVDSNETYKTIGKYGYLESLEYIMVNTYDVHFYASWALAMHFPLLEKSLQRDFCDALWVEYDTVWKTLHSGDFSKRKVRGAVPHDLGNPGDSPWELVNSYCIQEINSWKDLNCKLVLQIYRDYKMTDDEDFMRDCWPSVKEAIQYVSVFDRDGDGMIENENFPDQTYDTWSAKGPSAYCGGLWIAALSACAEIAKLLEPELASKYSEMWDKAKLAYHEKLWSGEYYLYDSSNSDHFDSIQADSMCGQWWARACGLPSIAHEKCIKSSLKKIFDFNVKKFQCGQIGPVNGMRPDGKVDTSCLQSVEVWTGTAYGLAAAMMQEGLIEEAFSTAKGIARVTYDTVGYMFQTPEAWDAKGNYRALAYMRPLSIWGIQYAWEKGARCIRPHPNRDQLAFEMEDEIKALKAKGVFGFGGGKKDKRKSAQPEAPKISIVFVGHDKGCRDDLFLACWQRRPVNDQLRENFQGSSNASGVEELDVGMIVDFELHNAATDDMDKLTSLVKDATVVVCSFSVCEKVSQDWVSNEFLPVAAAKAPKVPIILCACGIEQREMENPPQGIMEKSESVAFALQLQTQFPSLKANVECSPISFKGFRTLANAGLLIVSKGRVAAKKKDALPEAGSVAQMKMKEKDQGCLVM